MGARSIAFALGAILVAGLVQVAWDGATRARDARSELYAARDELLGARDTLRGLIEMDPGRWPSDDELRDAKASIRTSHRRVLSARARLGWTLAVANRLGWLPGWPGRLGDMRDLLDLAETVTGCTGDLIDEAGPLLDGDASLPAATYAVFVERASRIDALLAELEVAQARAGDLSRLTWGGPFRPADQLLEELIEELEQVAEFRSLAADLAVGLPPLLGFHGETRYIVLGQNSHELRATGGFIGTMGEVTVRDARVVESVYRSSYDYDPPDPPDRTAPTQIQRFLGIGRLHVRDANYSPDFPTSAMRVLEILEQDLGIRADGVVAVDTEFVTLLLRAFGPIRVPSIAGEVTAQDWFLRIEKTLADRDNREEAKASVLEPVLADLVDLLQDAGRDEIPELLSVLRRAARGRHLQVYHRDPGGAALVRRVGVSGALAPSEDRAVVAVVDRNYSYSKVQPAISREIVCLIGVDGSLTLSLRWRNDLSVSDGLRYPRMFRDGALWDPQEWRLERLPGVYGTYTTVYLPLGSEPIAFTGLQALRYEEEGGFFLVSGYATVKDGQQHTATVTVHPPIDLPRTLRFWKQAGAATETLRVLQNTADGDQLTLYSGPLTADLEVELRPSGANSSGPR